MLMNLLLPGIAGVKLDGISIESDTIHLRLQTTSRQAACPVCGKLSRDVHSRYQRAVVDLPWAGLPVYAALWVRRFFCHNSACLRKIFCERLKPAIAVYARRTQRLVSQLQHVSFVLGGEAGSRLIVRLGMLASPDTLLRLTEAVPDDHRPTPRVLGVDDWAKRKGQSYGTILIDLERHQPVDLLDTRSSDALADWLQAHPGVEIISRDRARIYQEGATLGAPDAIQIADRFHLIQNLVDTIRRMFDRHAPDLRATAEQIAAAAPASVSADINASPTESSLSRKADQQPVNVIITDPESSSIPPLADREKSTAELRFAEVKALQREGLSRRAIAQRLSMSWRTVARYAGYDTYPERAASHQSTSKAITYLPYLSRRWREGCHNAKLLFAEIQETGFSGSYSSVWRLVNRYLRTETPNKASKPPRPAIPRLSARQAAWLLVRQPEEMDDKQKVARKTLLEVSTIAAQAYPLARAFRQMINERQMDEFDTWLIKAKSSGIAEFRRFATSLQSDYQVVKNALVYPWSNGQVEGQVNRLKLIKRQMYGRASFPLLRKRVLYAG
jgi:transposase